MDVNVLPDAETAAQEAARLIAAEARATIAARGHFLLAVSGGSTPNMMWRALANEPVPWKGVQLFQVDERVAPRGHTDRNLTHLQENLVTHVSLPPEQLHAMPVEETKLEAAARSYDKAFEQFAGTPPVLDLVHLGLGSDGHTASLVPNDPALQVDDRGVALTGLYQGRQRMTLTYPLLNRARRILWLVTGADKASMLRRLRSGDASIPAGRIAQGHAVVFADHAAAG